MDKIKTPVTYTIYDPDRFKFAVYKDANGVLSPEQITTTLNTVADQSRVIEDVMPARKALDRQQQLDESGVMVGVSRQAVDEVCAFIDALAEAQRIMEGK